MTPANRSLSSHSSRRLDVCRLPGRGEALRKERGATLADTAEADGEAINTIALATRRESHEWARRSGTERRALIGKVSDRLQADAESLARDIVEETGKPIRFAKAELDYAAGLIASIIRHSDSIDGRFREAGADWRVRRRPWGLVAAVTPWNNPVAIPIGKIAPALVWGNTVLWKPSPHAAALAARIVDLLVDSGFPKGVVALVQGGHAAGQLIAGCPSVDALSFTGSLEVGREVQRACAARDLPFQGEFGGNNAAVVWRDADHDLAAQEVVRGAFCSAGQRCTANRRVIVHQSCFDVFLERLTAATRQLRQGDPLDERVDVGPLISAEAASRVAAAVETSRAAGHDVEAPKVVMLHENGWRPTPRDYPPTLVIDPPHDAPIVQDETFGPVLVVECAADWSDAINRCNHVRQGLIASLFSQSRARWIDFLSRAQAGILKRNRSTAGANPDAPFGGWKESGSGPFEHGMADERFFSRLQTLYGDQELTED